MSSIVRPDLVRLNSPIARLWRKRGFNAETLAAAVGVKPAHVYNIGAGRAKPSYDLLETLCRVLNARPDELFPQLSPSSKAVSEVKGDAD